MRLGQLLLAASVAGLLSSQAPAAPIGTRFAYVAGFGSGNVVRFDLSPGGAAEELVTLVPDEPLGTGDWPRGVAIDGDGNIYVGLRGGTQNVLKFAPEGTPLGSFTASIGGFGTGLIQFNDSGELIVAGDVSASSSVFRYDETGALIDSFNLSGFTNVVGLLVDGDFVYSAALFSGNVARYDLSGPVSGAPFITNAGQLNQPIGMTIGHTGNLFVANLRSPLIQEFDLATGAFIGTLLDIGTLGIPFVDDVLFAFDLHYDSPSGHYFLTVGTDSLIEFGPAGNLVATYSSPDLWGAYGFAIVASPTPEPSTWGLVAVGIAAVVWRRIGRRIGRLPSVLMRA